MKKMLFYEYNQRNRFTVETISKFNDTYTVLRPANLFCRKNV